MEKPLGHFRFTSPKRLFNALFFIMIFAFLTQESDAQGKTLLREWTSRTGSKLKAELIKVDGERITLLRSSNKKIILKITDLAKDDQQVLKELIPQLYGSKIATINAVPGKISPPNKCANAEWTYHAYLPKNFHIGRKWPVWFVFSPIGGVGGGLLKRYIAGAERTGSILIGSVNSKNGFMKSQKAALTTIKDVYKRFPVQQNFAFTSGLSGGSRMSYLMAEQSSQVRGILACGSGNGCYLDDGSFRKAKLRRRCYLYSLIGTNCFNRTGAYVTHTKMPKECRLRFFPGNHDWAQSALIEQAMTRVVGQAYLEDEKFKDGRSNFLRNLRDLAQEIKESAPWETYYLASFGEQFPQNSQSNAFKKLAKEASSHPKTLLAQKAEQEMMKFCAKYYPKYDFFNGDTEDIPRRSEEASDISKCYQQIPHGEIIRRMGVKSPGYKGK